MKIKTTMIAMGMALCAIAPMQAQESVITNPPGERAMYERCSSYLNGSGGYYYPAELTGYRQDMYFDGNDVYLKNPVQRFNQKFGPSYLKGTLIDEGTIEFEFPQLVGEEGADKYYAYRMLNDGGMYNNFSIDPNEQTIYFFRKSDGTWAMEESVLNSSNSADYCLGIVNSSSSIKWEGYGEYNMIVTPLDEQFVSLPDNVEASSDWILHSPLTGYMYVQVAIDGNDVYLGGLSDYCPGFVKGTIADNKVTFPSKQFIENQSAYSVYVFTGCVLKDKGNKDKEKDVVDSFTDEVVFDYNPETRALTNGTPFCINLGSVKPNAVVRFKEASIKYQDPNADYDVPTDPEILRIEPWDVLFNYGWVKFRFNNFDINGRIYDNDRLYFNMYVDDELFEFTTEQYDEIYKNMIDVPFGFSTTTQITFFPSQVNVFYVHFNFDGADTIGIRTFYEKEDGTRLYSNIVTKEMGYNSDSQQGGVNDVTADVLTTEYYDISGARVDNPEKGMFVKVETLGNGSKRTSKVVLK